MPGVSVVMRCKLSAVKCIPGGCLRYDVKVFIHWGTGNRLTKIPTQNKPYNAFPPSNDVVL